ncbi:PEP-CTERM protein-sorting domain-containing protein/RHS repeat-associated core domain-containing protein [Geoalkalibacter ferrihydriticus]|uniref:Teneurin-like YD-shell domain-containing protein n=2 Tax=Geoalkalibacter ferrihydriticus TaxID=392333 RepID=A0A0C2HYA6_9BACT|nr:RHS repeat-associated core domain-containing protein [Geoalkalibacter ferrihydriticus]KIH77722.1 hypothetical protein GFER_03450 [Geoalkalibacter ferrihydriticus DSM 17813]SDL75808.1 PEP-CTERM protein-sorting domain-containing protein/RHS repeat-associated core domain-containing protein [Geoalkalibacter ferrihydriticus]
MTAPSRFFKFFLLTWLLFFCFIPKPTWATAIAESSLSFSFNISPAAGNLTLLDPWFMETFAWASNSLGEMDFGFGFSEDSAASSAAVTWASGQGSSSGNTGAAQSRVHIPGTDVGYAESLGRGGTSGFFMITGGEGTVDVDFSASLLGSMFVFTDEFGVFAKTETIFGLELDGAPLLFFYDFLEIGPNSIDSSPISDVLFSTLTLDYDTPYFLYAEGDSESYAANVPEPSTFILLLAGLIGALLFKRGRKAKVEGRKNGFFLGGFFLCALTGFLLLSFAGPGFAKYLGAPPPPACDSNPCCPSVGPCTCEFEGDSALSFTEGNLQERRDIACLPTLCLGITYQSANADSSWGRVDTVLGYGWTHSFNTFLYSQRGHMFRSDEEGRVVKYRRGPGGTFTPITGYFETLAQNADGSFTLTREDGTVLNFAFIPDTPFMVGGPVFRLTGITDRNADTTTLVYAGGTLVEVVDPYGRSLEFEYDGVNKLRAVIDPLDRRTEFAYDDTGRNLSRITDPDGRITSYAYNMFSQLTGKVDPDGRELIYIYRNRKPVEIRDGEGRSILHLSNPVNWATDSTALARDLQIEMVPSTTTKKDARGNLWRYEYNRQGYITRLIAPDGATTSYTYDPLTVRLASVTDALGHVTHYAYDSRGNLIRTTDCQGNLTEYTYEPIFNSLTSLTDADGRVTTREYDARGNLVRETDPLGNDRLWTYDARGNVLTITDRNGNTTSHDYDAFGNRIKITDALGNVTTLTYDLAGNVLTHTDALERVTSYAYDALNRLITETDPLGQVTQYAYDGAGNRTQVIDAKGNATTYAYDLRGRLIRITDALGQVETQAYDGNGNRIRLTDQNGNSTRFAYDAQNRLIKTTDALGHTTAMAYDGVGNLVSSTDAENHTTTFAYDCLNRQILETDPLGCETRIAYAELNGPGCTACSGAPLGSSLPAKQIDALGKVTYFRYDDLGRLLKEIRKVGDTEDVINADDAVTAYTYDAEGNRLSLIEPNGNTTTFSYDALHQLIVETNAAGEATLTGYDAVGNITSIAEPNGNITSYLYDALDRVVRSEDLEGIVATFNYDPVGNRLSEADGNGNETSYGYDPLHRPVRIVDAMGEATEYTYDAFGNLMTMRDRENKLTRHVYDAVHRRVETIDAIGGVTRSEYDGVGNLVRLIDARGNATLYVYDPINRLTHETYADGGTRTFGYDCVGNLVTRTDQKNQTTTYTYNDLYFLIQRSYPGDAPDLFTYDLSGRMLSAEKGGWLVSFAYDGANRVTQTTQNGRVIQYAYDIPERTRTLTYPGGLLIEERLDPRGRLQQINDLASPPPLVTYAYDPGNRVVSRSYVNGAFATYSYNANNWITQLNHGAGAALIAGFRHDYDKEGNKRFEEQLHNPPRSEAYGYDAIYRLVDYQVGDLVGAAVPVPATQTAYDLDLLGNWNSKTTDGLTQNRSHNQVNELIAIDGLALAYDANGNLIEDERHTYVYDDENRLLRVTRNSDGQIVASYQYDALGRRVAKQTDLSGVMDETLYFHDDARVIEEQDDLAQTLAEYIYGNYVDEVLVMRRADQLFFYHQNTLWSVAAVTNSAAAVVERYTYDAYGCVSISDGAFNPVAENAWGTPRSAIENPWMFTGRQLDEETGLYFYRARYYDCEKGRFLQRDPILDKALEIKKQARGFQPLHSFIKITNNSDSSTSQRKLYVLNAYEYAASNPSNSVDPSGLASVACTTCICCGGIYAGFCSLICATSFWDDPNDSWGRCFLKCVSSTRGRALGIICETACVACVGGKRLPKGNIRPGPRPPWHPQPPRPPWIH